MGPKDQSLQLPWRSFVNMDEKQGLVQQWVLLPTLVPVVERTQPLAGTSPDTQLFHCIYDGGLHEHWTNIQRVEFIAQRHPLIESVERHNMNKSLDPPDFNKWGRTNSGHQSPYDLELVLAASGARIGVGITGNDVATIDLPKQPGGLLALWWRPFGVPSFQHRLAVLAEAIFLDITELMENIPDSPLGTQYGEFSESKAPAARASGGQPAASSRSPPAPATTPAAAVRRRRTAPATRASGGQPAASSRSPPASATTPAATTAELQPLEETPGAAIGMLLPENSPEEEATAWRRMEEREAAGSRSETLPVTEEVEISGPEQATEHAPVEEGDSSMMDDVPGLLDGHAGKYEVAQPAMVYMVQETKGTEKALNEQRQSVAAPLQQLATPDSRRGRAGAGGRAGGPAVEPAAGGPAVEPAASGQPASEPDLDGRGAESDSAGLVQQVRTRRRSKSREIRGGGRRSCSPMPERPGPDRLRQRRLSRHEWANLSTLESWTLDGVRKVELKQLHWKDSRWGPGQHPSLFPRPTCFDLLSFPSWTRWSVRGCSKSFWVMPTRCPILRSGDGACAIKTRRCGTFTTCCGSP